MAARSSFVLQDAYVGVTRAIVQGSDSTVLKATLRKYKRIYLNQRPRPREDVDFHLNSWWLNVCALGGRLDAWKHIVETMEELNVPLHRLSIDAVHTPAAGIIRATPFCWTWKNHHEQSDYIKAIVFAAFCASHTCPEAFYIPKELLHLIFEWL